MTTTRPQSSEFLAQRENEQFMLSEPCASCHVQPWSACALLTPERLDRLACITTKLRLSKHDILFETGTSDDHIYTVISGALKLYQNLPNGQRQIVGFPYPGDFLGLGTQPKHDFTAEALTETTLCQSSRHDFARLQTDLPELEHGLLQKAFETLFSVRTHMTQLGRRNALQRVASFLLQLVQRHDQGSRWILRLPMTRADIADYTGLTVETVSRSFSTLRQRKLIGVDTVGNIHLLSPERLRALAG